MADACSSLESDAVFGLAQHGTVEFFESGALLLDTSRRKLTELDAYESWVLRCLDGHRTVSQVVQECAATHDLSLVYAAQTVQSACAKLLEARSLDLVRGTWKGNAVDDTRYIQNPDVNLREEDEDGALLFNPDVDLVQLLNSTGLYIWNLCAEGRTVPEIVAAFNVDFEEMPEGEVLADVEEFLENMIDSGFIGTLETS